MGNECLGEINQSCKGRIMMYFWVWLSFNERTVMEGGEGAFVCESQDKRKAQTEKKNPNHMMYLKEFHQEHHWNEQTLMQSKPINRNSCDWIAPPTVHYQMIQSRGWLHIAGVCLRKHKWIIHTRFLFLQLLPILWDTTQLPEVLAGRKSNTHIVATLLLPLPF